MPQNGGTLANGNAEIQTIGIFRALQLSDMLCAVPALRALRQAWPHAEISLIGLPWAERFAARFSHYIDRFLPFPGHPALPEITSHTERFPSFLNAAQHKEFDLLVQMHGSGEITNTLLSLFGARKFAGFYKPGHWCPDPDNFLAYPEDCHEIKRLLRLARFVGAPADDASLEFPLLPADSMEADCIIEQLGLNDYICIHCGARSLSRRWPPERFARVADSLSSEGFDIVITGSLEERSLAQQVCQMMERPCINLAGKTSIGGIAALLNRSQLLVCNDTGVSHIAAALQIPSVVIFSGSDPGRWAPLNRELHRVCVMDGNEPVSIETVVNEARSMLRERIYAA